MTKSASIRELSIEYAHIYTNQRINEEHGLSLKELKKAVQSELPHEAVLTVLVDDYSFPDPSFDYDGFIDWLDTQGYKPDVVLRESQLIPVCDEVLKLIPDDNKLKQQLLDYIKSKKYPCSLFIAAWYLVRLGYIEDPVFDTRYCAKRLLNILPKSFEPFENAGLEIIKATPYKEAVDHVAYRWIEGRLII
jgi:hypothetical protein